MAGMLLPTLGTAAYQVGIASLLVALLIGIAILRGGPQGGAA